MSSVYFSSCVAIFVLFLVLGLQSNIVANAELVDNHESCDYWGSIGECEKNPGYMLENCAASCAKYGKAPSQKFDSIYGEFFLLSFFLFVVVVVVLQSMIIILFVDIVETDINGKEVRFDSFRGKVVYIVNVASYCGYTKSNYDILRNLRQYIDRGLVMVISPCNQFGSQEPGDSNEITNFVSKRQYEGIILSKGDVNGPGTRPLFDYLKTTTGKHYISWNFDGKFVIDRHGNVHRIDSENEVESTINNLLSSSEL